jgi:hypothetical protein
MKNNAELKIRALAAAGDSAAIEAVGFMEKLVELDNEDKETISFLSKNELVLENQYYNWLCHYEKINERKKKNFLPLHEIGVLRELEIDVKNQVTVIDKEGKIFQIKYNKGKFFHNKNGDWKEFD